MSQQQKQATHPAFYTLITVFFFWGFIGASTGVFIPFCKEYFELTQTQSQIIDFSIYVAYFIGAILILLLNKLIGKDFINSIGYKNGIIYGLIISAVGSLLMILSFNMGSYDMILISYFVIGLGFSLQQTCAQPFAVSMGNPASGGQRLSLAGGINSLGTTIGPIILGVILSYKAGTSLKELPQAEVDQMFSSMNILYLAVTALFLLAAAMFHFSKMPDTKTDATLNNDGGALKYPQLVLGMIGIFTYVGVEVSVQSNLGELLKAGQLGTFNLVTISTFISMYWGGLMVGRWCSGASVFKKEGNTSLGINIIAAILAYGVVCLANYLILSITGKWSEFDPIHFLYYAPVVAMFILIYVIGKDRPATTLMYLGLFGIIAMILGMTLSGNLAVYSFVAGGLACSIMWPFIFSLAISGLGKYTSQGSSLLIMMILGGGIVPLIQGTIADMTGNMVLSYIIPILCFAYLTFFAIRVKAILKNQGINADAITAEGGH